MNLPKNNLFNLDPEKVPPQLKERRQWICWKYDERDGNLTKVPIAPWKSGGKPVSANDPTAATDFNTAANKALTNPEYGLGFTFYGGDRIVGIDIDKCFNENGELSKKTRKILHKVKSYTEISPSGKGLHIIAFGKIYENFNNRKQGIEIYDRDRFFTFTGNHYQNTPKKIVHQYSGIKEIESEYNETVPEIKNTVTTSNGEYENKHGWSLKDIRNRKNNSLDTLLQSGPLGYESNSEADLALCCSLVYWEFEPQTIAEILRQYRPRKKLKRSDYVQRTIKKAIQFNDETISDHVDVYKWDPRTGWETTYEQETDYETDEKKRDKRRQGLAEKLIELVDDAGLIVFCDQHGDAYAQIITEYDAYDAYDAEHSIVLAQTPTLTNLYTRGDTIGKSASSPSLPSCEVFETHKLGSKVIENYISGLAWRKLEKAPGQETIKSVIRILAAKAREKPRAMLYNRMAVDAEDNWWLDLSNHLWQAVKIDDEDWEVVDRPPVLFRRYSHQQPLPYPSHDGNVANLLDYIKLGSVDDQLLFLVSSVSVLVPGIPHVVPILYGPKGTVKTTAMRVVKTIYDNSSVGMLTMPNSGKVYELTQQLDHHYIAFYDNLTEIDDVQSDILCRAVTGAGVSKRKLYTDDEDVTRRFLRCVGINGINIPVDKPDLLDRSILLETKPLFKYERRTKKFIESKLDSEASGILGDSLSVISDARRIAKRRLSEEDLPLNRMADFTFWGCAITEALGIDHKKFLVAYNNNIANQEAEAVKASIIGDILVKWLDVLLPQPKLGENELKEIKFTPTEFYYKLSEFAESHQLSQDFPSTPRVLSMRLNEIAPNLPSLGFSVRRKRTMNDRIIIFSRFRETKLDEVSTDVVTEELPSRNSWECEDLRDLLEERQEGIENE